MEYARFGAVVALAAVGLLLVAPSNRSQAAAQAVAAGNANSASAAVELAARMGPGWNLGNTLEATPTETSWGNPPASPALFKAVRAAGFRTVRIPVSWTAHADARFDVDSAWMKRVRQVVDEARAADLIVLLNVHWDGGWLQPTKADQAAADAHLRKLWTQIAAAFRDEDDGVLFAGTNEVMVKDQYRAPTGENAAVQNGFNQVFVDTVRASGGRNAERVLVVQGFNTNIDYTLDAFVVPKDSARDRLMVEVHYYDPYDFALNEKSGAWQWGRVATDPKATASWGDEAYADRQFERMKARFVDKGVPVVLGEYGATLRPEHKDSLKSVAWWDAYITHSAVQHGLVPVYWDNGARCGRGLGLLNRATNKPCFPDLVTAIVGAAK